MQWGSDTVGIAVQGEQETGANALRLINRELILLTGATGLVGSFVLARLLRSGAQVAVVVRNRDGIATAAQRIDEVLTPFEGTVQLPRPRIIPGDLAEAGLGISKQDLQWLQQFRLNVIHSAASIRFIADTPEGEPYRSNVNGMRNLLELLKSQNVFAFHYVSTAYVSCREIATNAAGQSPLKELSLTEQSRGGNDYEWSKITAERMLEHCGWIAHKTIIRPSIIVGSSQDGYTSSFHGFYAPLKIGAQLAAAFGFNAQAGSWFRNHLGLGEADSKNFVPVDWVADAIVQIAMNQALHGQIYHLTNPVPVNCGEIQTALLSALERKYSRPDAPKRSMTGVEIAQLPQQFAEQMNAYRSYFNNDPLFDCTNTQRALPSLPCPEITCGLLGQLADYALDVNFGWPRKPLEQHWWGELYSRLAGLAACDRELEGPIVELELFGPHACERLQFVKQGARWRRAKVVDDRNTKIQVLANVEHFAGCITGIFDIGGLVEGGEIVIKGPLRSNGLDLIQDWLQDLKLEVR